MNLRQLETFVKVAENGSFSKTAGELFMTQPTISAHINALEQELNVRLFVRNTREVNLSENGKELYLYARRLLELEKQMKEHFGVVKKADGNQTIVVASSIPAGCLLPEILLHFSGKCFGKQLKILEMNSSQVVNYISCSLADVGFTGTIWKQRDCKYVPLYKDQLVIAAPNQEKYRMLKEHAAGNISWILNERFIMRERGSGTRREGERILKNAGIDVRKLRITLYMEDRSAIKTLICRGKGISVMSKQTVEEEVDEGSILTFPIPKAGEGRDISLVYKEDMQMEEKAGCFGEAVRKVWADR